MEYDIEEKFRLDPGELELSDELQAERDLEQQQSAEEAAQAQLEQPPSTEVQDSSQTDPVEPTGSEKKEEKGFWDLSGFGQDLSYFGQPLEETNQQVKERLSSPGQGVIDFATEVVNRIPGVNIPKRTPYEDDIAEASRKISSVVLPQLTIAGKLRTLGATTNARVGASLGKSKFVQFMGDRGVEAATSLGIGLVSSEYTEDNATGTLKKLFPKTLDFIPDSIATLDTDSTDIKREKNIREDLGLGFFTDLTIGAGKFIAAVGGTQAGLRNSTRLVGETPQARRWLKENASPPPSTDPTESVLEAFAKQEDALDELGMYNYSLNNNLDKPLKGVHDLFDYTETGIRTVDELGAVGASIDQVRVSRNLGSVNGRLGNMLSEPALKYGLSNGDNSQDIVLGLADQLHKAGEIGMVGNKWKVSFKDVIDEGENLAIQLFDPRMSKEEVRIVLEPFITRTDDGKEVLSEGGFAMAAKALRGFGSELTSMDVARAQSLLAGSLSGRISDVAEGARLMDGSPAVKVAQEKIIDLMQYVTQLSSSAKYYKNRKVNLVTQVRNGFKNIAGYNEATAEAAGDVAQQIFQDSQRFANSLRQISENQPDLMKQFLMAYELSDGNIDTIVKMNHYLGEMTTNLGKGIVDFTPEIENKLIAGVWSNIYNNVLSGFVQPISATVGNFGGIISQPLAHFIGALPSGDFKAIHRGWIAYSSVGETLNKALPYAGDIFKKASQDPQSVRSATRLDLQLSKEADLEFLREAARVQKERGNDGLEYIVNQIELLNDLAEDPILRFGPNAMTAMDGFTGVFTASAEARFRAMDELVASGKPITKENVKPIADKYYNQMFGSDNLITDKAVKYATSEIALNLDTPLANNVTELTKTLPGIKPFLMFSTTGMNLVDIAGKYNPVWTPFQRDINELAFTKLDNLLGNEELVDSLLKNRNINISEMDSIAKINRIADLKYTTRGRKAMGALAVTSAIGLVFNDRITGDGLFDKESQRSREKQSNWKKRSIKGLDGKWYSYESLGPLADWVALTVNIADNFDMLGESYTEKFFSKSAFVLGAAVTDRTGLSTMKPLLELLSGNENAMMRFGAGFINGLGPLATQRGEWGKVFSEGLMEVNEDLISVIANRNRFTTAFDTTNRAPYVYSPVTGEKANGYGMLQRIWNAYSPVKIHAEQSPEEKFLHDFEFDINTTFRSKNGVRLTADERSTLFKLMGEQGIFRDSIREIMKDAGDYESIARLRQLRRSGIGSEEVSIKKWDAIHIRLSEARMAAEKFAYNSMEEEMSLEIEARLIQKQLREQASEQGEYLDIDESLNIRN